MILSQILLPVLAAITASGVSASPLSVPEQAAPATVDTRSVVDSESVSVSVEETIVEPRAIVKRSFIGSCRGLQSNQYYFTLPNGHIISGECRKQNGSWQATTLDLNNCLVNNNGHLQWRLWGGFKPSCPHTELRHDVAEEGDVYLLAQCRTSANVLNWTQINLDTYIHNWDGSLTCNPPP